MKYAVIAALFAAVSAAPCDTEATSWTIYKDAKCKKVSKKAQKKYGHIQDGDEYTWSGDCESYKIPSDSEVMAGKKIGVKVTCDADGFSQDVWKSNKCKGDSLFSFTAGWGDCVKGIGQGDSADPFYVKFQSTQFAADAASNMNVYKGAYNNWKKNFCVDVFENWNFEGATKKYCLDPAAPLNYINVPQLPGWNDKISSVHIGSKVKAVFYEEHLSHGFRDFIGAGKKVNVPHGDQYSSMRIYNAQKSACLFRNKGQDNDSECFPYEEKTGQAVFDLHYFQIGDQVSSLHVPAGVQVHLYHDYNQQGKIDTYTGPKSYDVSAASDDKYSSMKVCKIGVC